MSRILVVEDDVDVREMLCAELREPDSESRVRHAGVDAASCLREARACLEAQDYTVILLDLRLPDGDGVELLAELNLSKGAAAEVIVLTANATIATAVAALKQGACDFLEKPCRLEQLRSSLARAQEAYRLKRENQSLRGLLSESRDFVGPQNAGYLAGLDRIAANELPVLVTGPTGAGTEVVARQLHHRYTQASDRDVGPFLVVDCAALSSSLIESELFGYERGAFTGATHAKSGLVEMASRGTLFLDEIGELDLSLQAKLLRLLESREFRRVGGREMLRCDARIVAATHRDLAAEVESGGFREDLFYRLKVLTIEVPSLAARPEEIEPLATIFLRRAAGDRLSLTAEAIDAFKSYAWPGNIRELRNVIERAAVLSEGPEVGVEDLPAEIGPSTDIGLGATRGTGMGEIGTTLADLERQHILAVLEACGGNKTKTAATLGISASTLYEKLKRY